MDDAPAPSIYVVTGVMAAGKSTVAAALAERFARSAHVHGDLFRRMIASGRDPITVPLGPEAHRQLELRERLGATVADAYWRAGFSTVLQDIYVGVALRRVLDCLEATPLHVVVLDPDPATVRTRECSRSKVGYADGWDVEDLVALFRAETPRIGLWLDTSVLTVDETVTAILDGATASRIR